MVPRAIQYKISRKRFDKIQNGGQRKNLPCTHLLKSIESHGSGYLITQIDREPYPCTKASRRSIGYGRMASIDLKAHSLISQRTRSKALELKGFKTSLQVKRIKSSSSSVSEKRIKSLHRLIIVSSQAYISIDQFVREEYQDID